MKNIIIIIATILSFTATAQTAKEIEMVTIVNQVRTNPKSFIPVVEAYIAEMSSPKIMVFGGKVVKATRKIDPALITELKFLVSFLKTVKPVNALELSLATYSITKTQVNFLDSTKQVTHTNAKGETYAKRLNALGLTGGENCTTGDDVNHAMILLLLDFKAEVKAHRNNIFNPKYTKLSVGNSGNFWVQDFIN
jgi:uncharacterized protein YkwD